MGHIYKHTSPSGKAYIGQSTQEPEVRWWAHLFDAQRGCHRAFPRAIRKYGPDAFTHEILHDGIDDAEELNRIEIEAIARHGTFRNGYNMTPGGEGCIALSGEAEERRRARLREVMGTPEARKHTSKMSKQALARPEVKQRLSEASREAWNDPTSKHRAPGAKKIRSDRAKRMWSDQGSYQNSQEFKLFRSNFGRAMWQDPESTVNCPEYRARHAEAVTGARRKMFPNIFCDGFFFPSQSVAAEAFGIDQTLVCYRIKSKHPRYLFWHKIPNHNDPECDAVEECWALMQFAKACPDHENVPDWLRPEPPVHGAVPADFWVA